MKLVRFGLRLLILTFLTFFVLTLLSGLSFGGEWEVPLTLVERAGLSWKNYPVTIGFPLPKEDIGRGLPPRVLDPWGREVPSQAVLAGKWPQEGTPRWWLITFQASVNAGNSVTYTLVPGEKKPPLPTAPVQLRREDGKILVDNGRLRVELLPDKPLIHKLWFDPAGRGIYSEERLLIDSGAGTLGLRSNNNVFSTLGGRATVITVEEEGPLKATVRIRGELYAQDKKSDFSYDCRLTVLADTPFLKLEVTLTNTGADQWVKVDEAWLGFENAREKSNRFEVAFGSGGEEPISTTVGRSEQAWVEAVGGTGLRWGGTAASSQRFSELNARKIGWVDLTGEKDGITLGIENFWQHYPKRLLVTGRGEIRADLIPASSPVMWGRGMAKTHRFVLLFHGGRDRNFGGLMAGVLHQPPVAVLPAYWYNQAQVFPAPLLLAAGDYPDDLTIPATILRQKSQVDLVNLYGPPSFGVEVNHKYWGYFNYGDLITDISLPGSPEGDYWNNNYYDLPYLLLREFMQTGDPVFRELAQAALTHLGDVDLSHSSGADRITPGLEHVKSYRTGRPAEAEDFSYVKNRGLLLGYYLFGGRRNLELALKIADRVCLVKGVDTGQPRSFGLGIIGALTGYEASGEERYRERAREIARQLLAWAKRNNGCLPTDFIYQTGLAVEGLVELYRWDKEPELLEGIKLLVDQAIYHYWDEESGFIQNRGGLTLTSALILLYRETGRAVYREIAIKQVQTFLNSDLSLNAKEVSLFYRNLFSVFARPEY